jgi:hypothetical protein
MAGLGKPIPRKNQPVSFFLSRINQVSRSSPRTAVRCPLNISSHPSTYELRLKEQNLATHSVSSQCANLNHHRSHKIQLPGNAPHPPRPLTPVFFESVLTRTESQAYDFAALGKHEGNSGLEDERPAAYLCFGTLHAPHCATQVFVYLAEELPRLVLDKKPDSIGLFGAKYT